MLERATRIATTGSAFVLFGIGGAIMGALVFPVLRVWPGSREAKTGRTQRFVQQGFRLFVTYMRLVGILDVEIRGAERLWRPCPAGRLVLANHPTLLDVVLLISHLPQADCVVKAELFENPFLRRVVTGTGYLPNDSGPALVQAMSERLRQGRTLVLFPEGTRSPRGALGPFQRGAAHAALETGCEIQTVTITCEPPSFMRGQAWWDVPPRRIHYEIEVTEPWAERPTVDFEHGRGLAARELTRSLRQFFLERLGHGYA